MNLILGIETSCDETAVAVLEERKILSNLVLSQIAIHKKYQGIVPEIASRKHLESINSLIALALKETKIDFSDLSAVAVTNGPGLVGALLIGVMAAKTIAYVHRLPLIPVNHLEGHIFANFLQPPITQIKDTDYADEKIETRITRKKDADYTVKVRGVEPRGGHATFRGTHPVKARGPLGFTSGALRTENKLKPPFLGLIISGGHTDLLLVEDFGKYKILGRTRDDAVGEAYDKVAKLLNLGYPGGPIIDQLAKRGNPEAINFPRPYLWGSWDFSFSGLKTAVVNYVHYQPSTINYQLKKDIVASFQAAVVETLVKKTLKAAETFKMKKIVLGGGVAANSALRSAFEKEKARRWEIYYPEPEFCTDNAAMIACAAYYKMRVLGNRGWGIGKKKKISRRSPITYHLLPNFKVDPNLPLTDWR